MSAILLAWAYKQKTGSAITKSVLVKLVDNANDLGFAHPSLEYLVAHLELSERAVREHIKKLEELGLLTVVREKISEKVNLPNRYILCVDNVSALGEITLNRRGGAGGAIPLGQEVPGGGAGGARGVGQEVPPEPLSINPQENPQVEPLFPVTASKPLSVVGTNLPTKKKPEDSGDFDLWYAAYPRRVGRGGAEKAYMRALKVASAAELLAGAMRYATERRDEEPQYTKHPATWLNQKCWLDDDQPKGQFNGKPNHYDEFVRGAASAGIRRDDLPDAPRITGRGEREPH